MEAPSIQPLRIVVAVSNDPSDLYFANELARSVRVAGILVENQRPLGSGESSSSRIARLISDPLELARKLTSKVTTFYRRRFAIYMQPEFQSDFGDDGRRLSVPADCEIWRTRGQKDINAADNVAWLKKMRPDVVAVCGTSLMSRELIAIPPRGVLNLHGGLSQYYRGLNTTDWAVQNGEEECVGATVHFVAPGIDDGEIIYQGRPDIASSDHPNALYAKVVKLGARMMRQALNDMSAGKLRSVPLTSCGRLYLGSRYTLAVRAATWRKYQKGSVSRYVAERRARDARIALINPFNG